MFSLVVAQFFAPKRRQDQTTAPMLMGVVVFKQHVQNMRLSIWINAAPHLMPFKWTIPMLLWLYYNTHNITCNGTLKESLYLGSTKHSNHCCTIKRAGEDNFSLVAYCCWSGTRMRKEIVTNNKAAYKGKWHQTSHFTNIPALALELLKSRHHSVKYIWILTLFSKMEKDFFW